VRLNQVPLVRGLVLELVSLASSNCRPAQNYGQEESGITTGGTAPGHGVLGIEPGRPRNRPYSRLQVLASLSALSPVLSRSAPSAVEALMGLRQDDMRLCLACHPATA
jgi:hypothetical protein